MDALLVHTAEVFTKTQEKSGGRVKDTWKDSGTIRCRFTLPSIQTTSTAVGADEPVFSTVVFAGLEISSPVPPPTPIYDVSMFRLNMSHLNVTDLALVRQSESKFWLNMSHLNAPELESGESGTEGLVPLLMKSLLPVRFITRDAPWAGTYEMRQPPRVYTGWSDAHHVEFGVVKVSE